MNKSIIGICFILAGIIYGSLAIDGFYNKTLGWMVKNNWVKEPPQEAKDEAVSILGRKPTILFYASLLIIIGTFILWKQ